eukprot:2576300-Rhodomonas_salina.1
MHFLCYPLKSATFLHLFCTNSATCLRTHYAMPSPVLPCHIMLGIRYAKRRFSCALFAGLTRVLGQVNAASGRIEEVKTLYDYDTFVAQLIACADKTCSRQL